MTNRLRAAALVSVVVSTGCSLATGIRQNTEAIGKSTTTIAHNTQAIQESTKGTTTLIPALQGTERLAEPLKAVSGLEPTLRSVASLSEPLGRVASLGEPLPAHPIGVTMNDPATPPGQASVPLEEGAGVRPVVVTPIR